MRRGDHHDSFELLAFQQRIAVRRHFPGVDVARMRGNQRYDLSRNAWNRGLSDELIQHLPKFICVCGIELPGDDSLPNRSFHFGRAAFAR
jgi:hypothetical protein